TFARGNFSAVLLPSTVAVEGQVLRLEPLVVELLGGRVRARGHADFSDPEAGPSGRFAVNAAGVRWGGGPDEAGEPGIPVVADARFGLAGNMGAWAVNGQADLERDGASAQVELDARGNRDYALLHRLRATMPSGSLEGSGRLDWTPALGWDIDAALAGFDPGYFAPGWDGAIDGAVTTRGSTRDDGGLEVEVDVADLGGQLRGRAIDGSGRFAMHGPPAGAPGAPAHYDGELSLALGDSRVEATATIAERLDIDARLAPLHLSDVLPGAAGTVEGEASLDGTRSAPDIDVDLAGSGIAWGDYGAARARLRGRLPWRGGRGRLELDATGVSAGVAIDSVAVTASGAIESLQADAGVRGEMGALDRSATVGRRQELWQGALRSL